MSFTTPTISYLDAYWILSGPKCLPSGFSFLKNRLAKASLITGYRAGGGRVVLRKGTAHGHLRADGFEEARHHARPAGARVFLGRGLGSAGDANAVVPAITRHRRIEHRRRHAHTRNLPQAIIDLPELLLHLFGLVIAQRGVDPHQIAAL